MRTIEYDNNYALDSEKRLSKKVEGILYKKPDSNDEFEKVPSKLFLEIIKEAGYKTDWAYVHSHGMFENSHIGDDQPLRYIIFPKIERQLTAVIKMLGNSFVNKNVLDIGCGTKSGFDEVESHSGCPGQFEPWLARFLYKLGVNVIGIDVGNLSKEKFKTFNINLLKANSLKIFGDNYFDLIHSSALYTSPELQRRVEGRANDGSLEAGLKLAEILKPQILRILKNGGVYLFREELDYLFDRKVDITENNYQVMKSVLSPFQVFDSIESFEDL